MTPASAILTSGLLAQLGTAQAGSSLPASPFPYTLFVVLMVLAVPVLWLFWRRRSPRAGGNNRLLRIQESCMVGTRQFIVVAAYGEERVMVGISPAKIEFLCKLNPEEAAPAEEPAPTGTRFSRLFDQTTTE